MIEILSHLVFTKILRPMGYRREVSTAALCIFMTLLGLFYILDGGFYVFILVDQFTTLITAFLCAMLESLMVVYVLGDGYFNDLISKKTSESIPPYIIFCWKFTAPVISGLFSMIAFYHVLNEDNFHYPVLWANVVKYFLVLTPIILICYFPVKYRNEEDNFKRDSIGDHHEALQNDLAT